MKLDRRTFLTASLGLAAGASTTALLNRPRYHVSRKVPRSRVAILTAESYSHNLENVLYCGLELFHLDLRGKTVLLKPNLVDYIPGNHINTHPLLVAAAVECLRRLGAKNVLVGEGPGHQRDTELVLLESGFREELRQLKVPFVDLNRDELVMTPLLATYTGMKRLWLSRTVLEADFVVSMPKVKTHHWSGVTLSMKNMFGVVPGAKYGWPKNILHWKGIQESILDVCATVPVHFVIADAIVAMEGNGPLNGIRGRSTKLSSPMIRLRRMPPVRGLWDLTRPGSRTFESERSFWATPLSSESTRLQRWSAGQPILLRWCRNLSTYA